MKKVDAEQPSLFGPPQPARDGGSRIARGMRNIRLGDLLREAAQQSGERIALVNGVADPALRRGGDTHKQLLAEAEQVSEPPRSSAVTTAAYV